MGLRKERWGERFIGFCGTEEGASGRKVYRVFKKFFFDFFFLNILC